MRFTQIVASGLTLLSSTVVAHPGHDMTAELAARREYISSVKRTDLSHCSAKLKARGVAKRNVARRSAMLESARAKSEYPALE